MESVVTDPPKVNGAGPKPSVQEVVAWAEAQAANGEAMSDVSKMFSDKDEALAAEYAELFGLSDKHELALFGLLGSVREETAKRVVADAEERGRAAVRAQVEVQLISMEQHYPSTERGEAVLDCARRIREALARS